MKQETITLQTLLNLIEYLENEISNNTNFILSNYAILKNKSNEVIENKLKDQYEKRKKCIFQLQEFKLAKATANMEEIEGISNNSRIFELSDLKRTEKFLVTLLSKKIKNRKGKVENAYTFLIPKSQLEDELTEVREKISELKKQMSDFNETCEISVEVDEDLDLI